MRDTGQGAGARSSAGGVGPDTCGNQPHGGGKDRRIAGSDRDSLNLSTLERREQLYPFLQWVSTPAERQYIGGKIFEHIRSGEGAVSHVGELSQIRVPIQEVLRTRGLTGLQARAGQVRSARPDADTILLLSPRRFRG